MTRERMVPPDSGRPMRPGQDCPNCGSALVTTEAVRACSASCGHRQAVRQ